VASAVSGTALRPVSAVKPCVYGCSVTVNDAIHTCCRPASIMALDRADGLLAAWRPFMLAYTARLLASSGNSLSTCDEL